MRTKFVPKAAAPLRQKFGDLEVGQGLKLEEAGVVCIKVNANSSIFSRAGVEANCVLVGGWSMRHITADDLVIPVDLELREL